jgi:hypothetical protein
MRKEKEKLLEAKGAHEHKDLKHRHKGHISGPTSNQTAA